MVRLLIALLVLCTANISSAGMQAPRKLVASGGGGGTTISDDFNRANGGLGSNWTTITGQNAPAIDSNVVKGNTSSGRSGAWYNATTLNENQKACVKVTSPSDAGGVTVRVQPSAQTYYFLVTNGTQLAVGRRVAGTNYTLATYTNIVSGDTICLSASGSSTVSLVSSVNGSNVGTHNDSLLPITGGSPGIFLYDIGTVRVDDFTAENL